MNWPLWMLPIVVPLAAGYQAAAWFVNRVLLGDAHWGESSYQEEERRGKPCSCRACARANRTRP